MARAIFTIVIGILMILGGLGSLMGLFPSGAGELSIGIGAALLLLGGFRYMKAS